MEHKDKRPRPDQVSDLDEKPGKRQATPNAVYRNDSSWVHHILKQPDVGLSFDGNGIQNSGGINVGGDVNIGVQNRSDQDTKFLADLRSTDPHDDKTRIERTKGCLLRDSYRWILDHDDFRRWRDDDDQSRLLWIKGDPGKGKTMLLCGIIDELEKTPADTRTLCYFFCQATDSRLNNATAVLRSLIYQLLDQNPSIIGRARKKYDHAGKKLFQDVNSWDALSKMLFSILEESSLQNTYLVIDALDECETDLSQLLRLINQVSSLSHAKLIVSSRNRHDIEDKLRPTETQTRLVLELKENAQHVSWAVDTYISQCISELMQLQGDKTLQDQLRQKMQVKAEGTFLWVALVVQELREAEAWDVLEIIDDIPAGLNELYKRMMRQIQRLQRKDPEFCRNILSTITTAYRPLHLDELRALADLPPNISNIQQHVIKIVALCGSFLTIRDSVVYLVHQSAKDFLTLDRQLFPSGLAVGHNTIALKSIQVMSRTLRRDVYSLRAPGFPIDQVKPPKPDPLAPARYSCVYWVNHLADGNPAGQGQRGQGLRNGDSVYAFLEKHYLHWLEALSLLRSVSEGILQMSELAHLAQLAQLAKDGLRFLRTHKASIECIPLQTYASALVFSPRRSIIRELFRREEPGWMVTKPIMEDEWDACLQTLEGHGGSVRSVAFSGDGTQLASASYDETVKVWDAATGQCLRTLEGHSHGVSSVAFSGDGTQLASASDDRTVKVWDAATGQCLRTLEGHGNAVRSVAFSGDGTQLASASYNKTVKVWDAATGQCLWTLKGHSHDVYSVAFSGDGTQLASASYDQTVKVWDAATGQCLQTLEGHGNAVRSVAFSGDGTQLASASGDCTVKVWDAATGQCLWTLEGHSHDVYSVAFSGDGTQLASASDDRTIKVWDAATGQCLRTLEGHGDFVSSVAFSGDGTQLASASYDQTVKVWDAATGQCLRTLEGHSHDASSVAFSGDGTQLASASSDRTIKVWDAATGQCLRTLEGHGDFVSSVAFSGDGTQLASASYDHTVKVWDAATGQCLWTLEGHSHDVYSVAFSGDGTQLASASDDRTVKVWDAATGQCLRTLEGHGDFVSSVAFSGDGMQLASASYDQTVKVWDAATGQCLRTLEGHSRDVSSVAFSGDGTQLASASDDRTVKVWDTATGQCLRTLNDIPHYYYYNHNSIIIADERNGDASFLRLCSECERSVDYTEL
ncbi:vegetative incompatibility protein HET-E-1 [Colletotrichum spaethianum]|uniref:Vegetative incompatibility protein HET-E-1 n=1 Tax=Colletotrichum spaethianum TaxID=700344 RepID=A0AA37USE1_9PEZI|nr:vegetative incompatibility protein HET-E-1 [Colletotrichum spaethianum]GKT52382.1 vegetative incompatibility protein HET-E-1 [Colletotrichum spaethianum]